MRMRTRRRVMADQGSDENFWPSFTDLTSTIALILFVLVLLAYIQNLISGRNLERSRQELAGTQQGLELSQRRLRALQADISAAQARLALSQAEIDQQKNLIGDSNRELGELRARLQGIAVLRVDMLQKVKQSIEAELRTSDGSSVPPVLIADNGNIVINESLVFEYDSYTIKKAGKALLDTLARAFANVLSDPNVRENVDVILVQGHTDERGAVAYNRELSGKRANAVLNYMFEANSVLEQTFGSYFASSAYSEFRPLDPAKTEAAYERNRRIEISVGAEGRRRARRDRCLHAELGSKVSRRSARSVKPYRMSGSSASSLHSLDVVRGQTGARQCARR